MEVVSMYGDPDDVAWKVGRIMLRYRPIAPKPATGGAATAAPVDPRSTTGKRRKTEGKRGRKSLKKAGASREESINIKKACTGSTVAFPEEKRDSSANLLVLPPVPETVGSWVTVECVTDTWQFPTAGPPILETDTCPCFVSDDPAAGGRVTWTNAAYRRMVAGPEGEKVGAAAEAIGVGLVTNGMVPAEVTAFTCGVRVRYRCVTRGREMSMVAPCDVWRVGDVRQLAWRVDVKAALSLSIGC